VRTFSPYSYYLGQMREIVERFQGLQSGRSDCDPRAINLSRAFLDVGVQLRW
jgi:hypothetical protein